MEAPEAFVTVPPAKRAYTVVDRRDDVAGVCDRPDRALDDDAVLTTGNRAGVGHQAAMSKADAIGHAGDRAVVRHRARSARDVDARAGAQSSPERTQARDRTADVVRHAAAGAEHERIVTGNRAGVVYGAAARPARRRCR